VQRWRLRHNTGPAHLSGADQSFRGARAALRAPPSLAQRGGLKGSVQVCSRADAEREFAAALRLGVAFVALGEPGYPSRAANDRRRAAAVDGARAGACEGAADRRIVGSRNASGAGLKFTQRIVREPGEAGFAIASGLARSIDAAAHSATLASGTIAVLAGGGADGAARA
jgi:DNA processing protein